MKPHCRGYFPVLTLSGNQTECRQLDKLTYQVTNDSIWLGKQPLSDHEGCGVQSINRMSAESDWGPTWRLFYVSRWLLGLLKSLKN